MSGPVVRVPPSTGWVERHGVVYAARLPDGPPLVLADAGAVVWAAVVPGGLLRDVEERVAAATGQSVPVVRTGVQDFVAGLVDAGVLVVTTTADDH